MESTSSICFICLNGNNNLKAVLQNGNRNDTAVQVKYVLPELTIWDSVYICCLCCSSLDSFYNFKKRCVENYNHLMNKPNRIEEIIEPQTSNESFMKEEQELNIKVEVEEVLSSAEEDVEQHSSKLEYFHPTEFVKCETQPSFEQDCGSSVTSEDKNPFDKEDSDTDNENFGVTLSKERTTKTSDDLLPTKSRALYDKEYKIFMDWKQKNSFPSVNETVMMSYFKELSGKYTPNSLWTKYSILKSTLNVNDSIDMSRYNKLLPFLKNASKGYVPKKSKVLTGDQVLTFMKEAPDDLYLLHKVVLVMSVYGGLRRDEMVKMTIDDVQDKGSVLLVKVPETKIVSSKGFIIMEETEIGALNLVRTYAALRPPGIKERRFFLSYRNNRCTVQPVGKNTIGRVPKIVAKYLKLDDSKEYTGHSLRRTSSTLLIQPLKMHGKRKCEEEVVKEKEKVEEVVEEIKVAEKPSLSEVLTETQTCSSHTSSEMETNESEDINNMASTTNDLVIPTKQLLLPTKSKTLYENAYKDYQTWCSKENIKKTTEDSVLSYFNSELNSYKSSSLWTKYSMLRTTIKLNEKVDISKFPSVIPYLKKRGQGHKAKQSLTLTKENVENFLTQANDKEHLLNKVVLIFGVAGACRRQELVSLETTCVQDHQTHFLIKLLDAVTKAERSFIILPGDLHNLNILDIIRKYTALRSPKTHHNRFFLNYLKEKCTVQPVGVHKIASVPSIVAKFLNLENPTAYTSHCFRRTSVFWKMREQSWPA